MAKNQEFDSVAEVFMNVINLLNKLGLEMRDFALRAGATGGKLNGKHLLLLLMLPQKEEWFRADIRKRFGYQAHLADNLEMSGYIKRLKEKHPAGRGLKCAMRLTEKGQERQENLRQIIENIFNNDQRRTLIGVLASLEELSTLLKSCSRPV